MRFRGKAAFIGAAVLSAALAFNKPPMNDAFAGKKGDSKLAESLKKARNIPPKNYKIEGIRPAVENGKGLVSGMKINGNGFFVFNIKKINLNETSWITAKVKIKYNKEKDAAGGKIIIYTQKKNVKGAWVCGIPFKKLAQKYKTQTKNNLEYTVFGIKRKQNGDFDMYIIPVETFGDAQKGNIKPGVPFLIIPYDAKSKNFKSHFGRNIHNLVEG